MQLAVRMPTDSDRTPITRPGTRRERLLAGSMCLVALLIFYVFSAGPMAGLHKAFPLPQFRNAVEILYAPIIALYKSGVEPFAKILKWYIDLFR